MVCEEVSETWWVHGITPTEQNGTEHLKLVKGVVFCFALLLYINVKLVY